MFRFKDPWFLLLTLIIVLVVYFYVKSKNTSKIRFSSIEALKSLKPSKSLKFRHLLIVLRCLALLCLLIAFARPQSISKTVEHLSEGIDIILCLDTSGSMVARDYKLLGKHSRRIDAVKNVVMDFIKRRDNDRIGMVVFGDDAFTQCPLTTDYDVLQRLLDKVHIGMVGRSTAIGNAIALSVKRLKDVPAKSKVTILLTDGMNTSGRISPEIATEVAKTIGVKIYTIGVGSGRPYGTSISPDRLQELDEPLLKMIAKETGGMYFNARNTKGLQEIYKTIDELETTEVKIKEFEEYNELFPGFLVFGLIFLFVEVSLKNTRFLKIP